MSHIARNLEELVADVAQTAESCGRSAASVRLLAVSKTFSPEVVRQAVNAGHRLFGENRVQEAEEKIPQLPADLHWHLIGHLQSNKAKRALELFDLIESLDSPKLAARLGRLASEADRPQRVLVQVNLGDEPQKYGVGPEELHNMVETVDREAHLILEGLMTIPPYHPDAEESRPYFQELARLLREVNNRRAEPLEELSMGMTGDYRVAIQEGATIVRVGTAIFGRRG